MKKHLFTFSHFTSILISYKIYKVKHIKNESSHYTYSILYEYYNNYVQSLISLKTQGNSKQTLIKGKKDFPEFSLVTETCTFWHTYFVFLQSSHMLERTQ